MNRITATLVALFLVCLAPAASAYTNWYVDVNNGSDANAGTSKVAPFKTITHALNVAGGVDSIYVARGTYDKAHGEIFPLKMQGGLWLIGSDGALATTISAGGSARVIECLACGVGTIVRGFTIANGFSTSGAGVYSEGDVWLDADIIRDNIAKGADGVSGAPNGVSSNAGGAYISATNGKVTSCLFLENTVYGGNGYLSGSGGQVYSAALSMTAGVIANNTFVGNSAYGGNGGSGAKSGGNGGDCNFSTFWINNGVIQNNLVANNLCSGGAGGSGLFGNGSSGKTTSYATFAANSPTTGGSNVLWNNQPAAGAQAPNLSPTFFTISDPQLLGNWRVPPANAAARSGITNANTPVKDLVGAIRSTVPTVGAYETVVPFDFDGDRRSDLLWRSTVTGENRIYYPGGNGFTFQDVQLDTTLSDQNWKCVGRGDFDGDGRADILWRNVSTGQTRIYIMHGSAKQADVIINSIDPLWKVVAVTDLDGDGKADIVLRHPNTGQNWVYLMNGTSIRLSTPLDVVADPNMQVAGSGDFDGDGNGDLLWRNVSTGATSIYFMKGAVKQSVVSLPSVDPMVWKVEGVADYDGNGKVDIFWRNQVNGDNVVWVMDGANVTLQGTINNEPDQGWQAAVSGDFNRDGKADLFWRHNTAGVNWLYLMNGAQVTSNGMFNTVGLEWNVF